MTIKHRIENPGGLTEDSMEPRWIKQTDQFSCGPIAIANALKWSGEEFSWTTHGKGLKRDCKVSKEYGTETKDLNAALRKYCASTLSIVPRKRLKLATIVDHVEGRGAVLLDFTWPWKWNMARPLGEREGHYSLLVDIMGTQTQPAMFFKLINLDNDKVASWIHREHFKKLALRGSTGDYNWLLKRRRIGRG